MGRRHSRACDSADRRGGVVTNRRFVAAPTANRLNIDSLRSTEMLRMVFVGVSWVGFASSAMAEVVEFVVDPTLTRWELDGSYYRGGIEQGEFAAQAPGSEITSLSGILRVDLTPTTIQFLAGSVLDAVPQTVPQQPGTN